ncbi:MAG: hypothetical protein E7A56_08105 [Cutibacterium avidum]|nr:hypothetical protein [Cutibacterium avidum]
MVQVSQSGTIISPSSLSNATVDKTTSWTVATGTTSGCATYTIADPAVGPVTIKLGNAYGSQIPVSDTHGSTHPNQAVVLSGISCGTVPPTTVTCTPDIGGTSGIAQDHGRVTHYGTEQAFVFAGSGDIHGLPQDATITAISLELWVQDYDERGEGVPAPNAPIVTNKGSFSGTDIGSVYSTSTGLAYGGSTCRPSHANDHFSCPDNKDLLYNGGRQTTGPMWDPRPNVGSATVSVTTGISNHTLSGPNTRKTYTGDVWKITYTGDPAIANSLLKTSNNGCKGFSTSDSKDTPLVNVQWRGYSGSAIDAVVVYHFNVTYTSGGVFRTVTYTHLY